MARACPSEVTTTAASDPWLDGRMIVTGCVNVSVFGSNEYIGISPAEKSIVDLSGRRKRIPLSKETRRIVMVVAVESALRGICTRPDPANGMLAPSGVTSVRARSPEGFG